MVVALDRDLRGAWRDMIKEREGKEGERPLTRFCRRRLVRLVGGAVVRRGLLVNWPVLREDQMYRTCIQQGGSSGFESKMGKRSLCQSGKVKKKTRQTRIRTKKFKQGRALTLDSTLSRTGGEERNHFELHHNAPDWRYLANTAQARISICY